MMDMGFLPQINSILEVKPSRGRQNLLFSATFPPKVEQLSQDFVEDPVKVEADLQATAAQTVAQTAYEVPNLKTKLNLLIHLLGSHVESEKSLVFVRNRTLAESIFKFVDRKFPGMATVIHANKGQNTRLNAAEKFRDNKVNLLIATDVVARGIDIAGIACVYNFDVPTDHSNYVHRIGRTGRALQLGKAITFVNMAEKFHFVKIEGIIRQKINLLPLPPEVEVTETPFEEKQAMLREIDEQRKKADPSYKGAFHAKKVKPGKQVKQSKSISGNKRESTVQGRKKPVGGKKNR
jgi:ATP-dependent RNA helicase RhlE